MAWLEQKPDEVRFMAQVHPGPEGQLKVILAPGPASRLGLAGDGEVLQEQSLTCHVTVRDLSKPERGAFDLLQRVYAAFELDADRIPDAREFDGQLEVDPEAFEGLK